MPDGDADARGPLRAAFSGLTTRGRSFLAAGAAAGGSAYVLGQPDLLRVGMLLTVLPVLCVLVLHRTRSRVAASRLLTPDRVTAGGESRVHLRVENVARGMPTGVLMLQDRVPCVLGSPPRFVLDRIPPGGRRELTYRVRSDLRGRYPLGPLQLQLTDPFGMAELTRSFHASDTLTVLPHIEPLPSGALPGDSRGHGDGTRRTVSRAGDDDVIPREYRHGDDLRRVHWRSTAHRGTLMMRREEQPLKERCTVLLDTRHAGYEGAGPHSPFEQAVAGAASVVSHLVARDYAVQLLTDTGALLPGTGAEGAGGAAEISGLLLDALAVVTPSQGSGFEGARSVLREGEEGLLIAFLGSVDAEQADLLGGIRRQARGGVAFAAAGRLDAMLEMHRMRLLREAGWTVLPFHPGVPLSRLWHQASAPAGRAAGAW
ncbi:DUF58 domain-containing protein [Streptomyces sp. ACA25]|uniref:DUF58 domain-containing protein n=1 Tax=Streptomyces sp. ACA25 TaxID=3022596 RepID=UPI002307790A|nr:DUF58 domain-containing protein [Streptomyces sp. ACA25]MDB1089875.1 DUF58 domain-containing protein [Streptomyces sp. ACA25]